MNEVIENVMPSKGRLLTFKDSVQHALGLLQEDPECQNVLTIISDQDAISSDLAEAIGQNTNTTEVMTGER